MIEPEPFDPKLFEDALAVAVAARSRRWSVRTIAEAFDLNPRTVRTLRDGRHGRYAQVQTMLEKVGQDFAERAFLTDRVVGKLNDAQRQLRLFGRV